MACCAKQASGTKVSNAANRTEERTRLACSFFRWLAGKHVFGERAKHHKPAACAPRNFDAAQL